MYVIGSPITPKTFLALKILILYFIKIWRVRLSYIYNKNKKILLKLGGVAFLFTILINNRDTSIYILLLKLLVNLAI